MNASNLKYRNRLKRRVMITRQQLYQPAPLHEPAPADHSAADMPRRDLLVDDNNLHGHDDLVLVQEGSSSIMRNNNAAKRDGYVSGRSGSNHTLSSFPNNHHNNRSDSRLYNININNSKQKNGSHDENNFTRSKEGEAMLQRAKEIISQRNNNRRRNHNISPKSSPVASSPSRSNNAALADSSINDTHGNFENSQTTPTRKNSAQRKNTIDNQRGGAVLSKEQQRWPQQTYNKRAYNNTNNNTAAAPSKSTITLKSAPPQHHHNHHHNQYRASPPQQQQGHDEIMSTTTSILTDEAMEDRNSMIRNVIQWERRMQLKRQQQQQQQQQQQEQQQQLQLKNIQQSKNDGCMKPLSEEEEEEDIVSNLVHEAIAINGSEGMIQRKSTLIQSSKTTLKTVVTPDDKQQLLQRNNYDSYSTSLLPPPPPTTAEEKEVNPSSPAPTDHSADAAAGMMFALHGGKNSGGGSAGATRKKVDSSTMGKNEEQERNEVTTTTIVTPTSTPRRRHHRPHHQQLNLEQKLGRLAPKTTTTSPNQSSIHGGGGGTTTTSKVSVISIQPSIESECVRQNAEILLEMEDVMMEFLVGGSGSGLVVDDDGGVDEITAAAAQCVNDIGDDQEEGDGVNNEERLNQAFSSSKDDEDANPNQLSLDERDDFADPPFDFDDPPLVISDSDSDASSRSGSMSHHIQRVAKGELILPPNPQQSIEGGNKDKDLGTFLDQLSSLFGVRCAPDRDEDSDVFYMNNSQFNTSLFSANVEEELNQRRMEDWRVNAEKDTRQRRRNDEPTTTIPSSDSFCGESHTTMPRGNTAERRDQVAYLSPPRKKSGPQAFQFERHDVICSDDPPDPDLSLEVNDDDDDDDESNCLPDPEGEKGGEYRRSGRDPPRGIDPEEGEDVLYRNQFQNQSPSDASPSSSDGPILDDEMNTKQLTPTRAKSSEEVETTSKLPSISSNATMLQEHFVENEHKLSPNYRRRGGGRLHFIDEVEEEEEDEEEDASDSSDDEESAGPQYEYEQFMEDFRDIVQNDPNSSATSEPEQSVEELVIGSISESSSVKDEDVNLPENVESHNMTQRREVEAAMQRSLQQASFYNRQRKYVQHDPKRETKFEGQQQERHTTQSSGQPGNRVAVKPPLHQDAHDKYKHPPQAKAAKPRLDEKLRGLGAPKKLSGDSVATSELGSLYSASVAASVPKTIFHRTNPPPPSSMQNVSNQEARQRALNALSRGLTPDFSSEVPKNTLGFIPIGSETWELKHEFLDPSPIDPQPRRSPLGFFHSSTDESSQVSDGFGRLNNNTLGSLQVGTETWNLKHEFNDSPANRSDPDHPPQQQEIDRRQHSEPVPPPNVNRYIPSRPPQPVRNYSREPPPKKLVMKSSSEIRDGTNVQTLRFVGREESPSSQQHLPPSTRPPSGKKLFKSFPSEPRPPQPARNDSRPPSNRLVMKSSSEIRDGAHVQTLRFIGREESPSPQQHLPRKKLFQSFPSAAKVARSAPPHHQSQQSSRGVNKSNQSMQGQMLERERRHSQGAHIGMRQTANNPKPMTKRSLDDNLRRVRSIDPPSSEKPAHAEGEDSQVGGSVFEAVEVGSFGVQHMLFSKWDKPPAPPQRKPPGVSYVSTFNGRQDEVDAPRSNLGRFWRKK